jgi:hypothetical protein
MAKTWAKTVKEICITNRANVNRALAVIERDFVNRTTRLDTVL